MITLLYDKKRRKNNRWFNFLPSIIKNLKNLKKLHILLDTSEYFINLPLAFLFLNHSVRLFGHNISLTLLTYQ